MKRNRFDDITVYFRKFGDNDLALFQMRGRSEQWTCDSWSVAVEKATDSLNVIALEFCEVCSIQIRWGVGFWNVQCAMQWIINHKSTTIYRCPCVRLNDAILYHLMWALIHRIANYSQSDTNVGVFKWFKHFMFVMSLALENILK